MTPVEKAIDECGGLQKAAEALGVRYQAVQKWLKGRVPAERVVPLSEVSGVSREDLRPDLYPPERTIPSLVAKRKRA